ncbi:unnamed protein product, partial [Mesorhabditis belari]|uniref:Peptidase M1 leukotriene A4 hydrolase/aminopeptidase C-terminal domain-containing protein n=1 Tax=Mesorhabditis belari TaxID=2138241 RepID=A0AAF3FSA8_9BILA
MVKKAEPTKKDPASYANFTEITVTNIDLKYVVDMDERTMESEAEYELEVLQDGVQLISFDTRDCEIHSITLNGQASSWKIHPAEKKYKGENLIIETPKGMQKGQKSKLFIKFTVKSTSLALQWMTKEQTIDKKYPLMFTYNQPINARAIVPCMDTPSVKATINYEISAPNPLQVLCAAVESKEPTNDSNHPNHRIFHYRQKIPIPSYLIAFLVGHYVSAEISDRIRVWTEPSILEKARYELETTEEQLKLAESILGKFVWERNDLVVLPNSFPFGGMENPNMIFLTPSLLAGDRSLVHLVTHELVHSWSGNLVTNATWEHMWLNEGFTKYYERRILGAQFGEQRRDFSNLNGWTQNLRPVVYEQFDPEHPWTALVQDHSIEGDPISSFSMIYYEKGQAFLYTIEKILGKEELDRWFHKYLEDFSGKALNTDQWKEHFCTFFADKAELLAKIDFDAWMYGKGMPPVKPNYDDSLQVQCQIYADLWVTADEKTAETIDTTTYNHFNPHQKIEFISILRNHEKTMSKETLAIMEKRLHLETLTNVEMEYLYYLLGLKTRWEPIIDRAKSFVERCGRLKFSRPVYRELLGWERTQKETIDLFNRCRSQMHPLGVEYTMIELKKFNEN